MSSPAGMLQPHRPERRPYRSGRQQDRPPDPRYHLQPPTSTPLSPASVGLPSRGVRLTTATLPLARHRERLRGWVDAGLNFGRSHRALWPAAAILVATVVV